MVHNFLLLCYNFGVERKNKLRKQKLKSYTKQLNSNNFDVDNELEIEKNSCLLSAMLENLKISFLCLTLQKTGQFQPISTTI